MERVGRGYRRWGCGGDYVILGYKSCLEFFTATFAGDGRTLELTPNNTFPGTVDRSVEEG